MSDDFQSVRAIVLAAICAAAAWPPASRPASAQVAASNESDSEAVEGTADSTHKFNLTPSAGEPTLLVSDDLELDLLLRDPIVANPVYLSFDERGRLWVVEYRQYPWPAGQKLLSRDSVWRNVYDPPFAPPPPHAADSPFRGKDQISIHEDSDGDGTFDLHKVFVDGLNLTTAALPGRGGVFVMNPPYLLFYADRDGDDRPDSPQPQVLLSGFGIADSHSIANSLRWGPDGWIYGAQGSTVSGAVVTHDESGRPRTDRPAVQSLGQNVWRYHPERRVYEIYAEGGGNAFGVEIDEKGRIFSGHNGGDTRGFHYIQGGYWQKNFSKHGQLSNPYAFDFHLPMRHHAVQRFTHTFCIYESWELPSRYHGALFGVNPIEHHVVLSQIDADGSSRQTRDLGLVVRAGDADRANWFTPVDIQLGPDGALYIADWYAVQAAHFRAHEGQTDSDLGRVYRLRGRDYRPAKAIDLAKLSSTELVERYLSHPNRWYRQQTRRLLGDLRDEQVAPLLRRLVREKAGQDALEAFWALHVSGGLTAADMAEGLKHEDPHVRRWAVHLIGDQPDAAMTWREELQAMARAEPNVEVRCQLAATAKRLPSALAIPLVFALLDRADDASDIYLPRTLWWSLEAHAHDPELILAQLASSRIWESPFRVAEFSFPENLMRRYAIAGKQEDLELCARLLQLAPDSQRRDGLVKAFAASFVGRSLPALPTTLVEQLAATSGPLAQVMAIRRLDSAAIDAAISSLNDAALPLDQRVALIQALGDVKASPSAMLTALESVLASDAPAAVKNASLSAMQKYATPEIGATLVGLWSHLPDESRPVAIQVLASRTSWAPALLRGIEEGVIDAALVDEDAVLRMRRLADESMLQRIDARFPSPANSLSDFEARIESLSALVKAGDGAPLAGRTLFHGKALCGKCHRLFHEGGDIGPDLTPYNRTDPARVLLALVNPNAEIREGFETYTVLTVDGLVLSGFKVEENDQILVLRGSDGQTQTIPKPEIEDVQPSKRSLMPEGLLNVLTDEEVKNLVAYLGSDTPPL